MKKLLGKLTLMVAFFGACLTHGNLFAQAAGDPVVRLVDDGTIIMAYRFQQDEETVIIQGVIGSVDTTPDLWARTDLSTALSNFLLSDPLIYRNDNGDVLVLWQYVDNEQYELAAAVLPAGQTDWFVSRVSSNTYHGGGNVAQASLDENGNLFVTWVSYIENEMVFAVVGNDGTIVASPELDVTWDNAYRITLAE